MKCKHCCDLKVKGLFFKLSINKTKIPDKGADSSIKENDSV